MTAETSGHLDDGWLPDIPTLPRPAAVTNLTNALEGKNLSREAARALARAAARPDDMRRKLADPVELRVQGGTLLLVETRLWSAAVLPHPANPREYGHRTYALGGEPGGVGNVLLEPESMPNGHAELVLTVDTPEELIARLADAEERLVRTNPLVEDLQVEGVLQPLTVVALTAEHADRTDSVTFLIAADGSSRISSAHRIQGYPIPDLIYTFPIDERKFRLSVSSQARLSQRGDWGDLSDRERGRLRVLTVPARVVVGFQPEPRAHLPFHTAIRNFIGLTHIRPPKAYGRPVENEAKADAVLDALARPLTTRPALIRERKKSWLAATASVDQIVRWGFPEHLDLRAAEIIRAILAGGNRAARRVNDGIRSLTVQQQPKREDRVDIAVELILRPLRTREHDSPSYVRPRRAVLQRAYRLPEIADLPADEQLEGMSGSKLSLEQLRDQALEEAEAGHGDDGRLAPAQTELAVKAVYYMAASEPMALQRELFGGTGDEDDRSPAVVMRAMLSRRRGVLQAYRVVKAGRASRPLIEVDDDGKTVSIKGEPQLLTDDRVRYLYNGEVLRDVAVGAAAAKRQWQVINAAVVKLKKTVDDMMLIPTHIGGSSIVQRDGWPAEPVRDARDKLDVVDRRLAGWAELFENKNENDDDSELEN